MPVPFWHAIESWHRIPVFKGIEKLTQKSHDNIFHGEETVVVSTGFKTESISHTKKKVEE